MASQDVLLRTQQLIDYLHELAQTSNLTADQVARLEEVVKNLSFVNTDSINKSIELLLNFREQLRGVGVDSASIYNASQYYMQLTRALELTNVQFARLRALGQAGGTQLGINNLVSQAGGGQWQAGMGYDEEKMYQLQRQKEMALMKANLSPGTQEVMEQTETITNEYRNLTKLLEHRDELERQNTAELEKQTAEAQRQAEILESQNQTIMGKYGAARTDWRTQFPGYTATTETNKTNAADLEEQKRTNLLETKKAMVISPEELQKIGLSSVAADNLTKKLEVLGMTQGRVLHASTELSTGITTVSMAFEKQGQVTQTYNAHISKSGMILQDTQKRFRDFGSAVMRDVVEVLKWTIAIGAIYTPIRKLGEMLQQMKDIQLAMVDVQIVLGSSTQTLNTAFEAAGRVATETSSDIMGVIQGYSLAAGAAASAGNSYERLAATESLLKNSMILSKIAGIDQKASLDTLVGALSQAGLKLTEGTRLLDSWVAVSKQSNVSVNQMATTFSIVGSAAQEIGLSFDELNAMVGALGQATNLSADEIGNSIRGIIAAMQTDKASAEFAKYGVATKTLNGDMRDLMEVLRELKVMQQTGILDEKAMGALMQAGGAGARRGAQLSALVKNLGMVMNLVAVSESASGDAAKAMGLEMETLSAAATRLTNAFAQLAQTLGGEGGILDFLTLVTKGATSLVGGIKDLVSVMKWAAPIFATFLLAKGIGATSTGVSILSKELPTIFSAILSAPVMSTVAGGAAANMGKYTPVELQRLLEVTGNANKGVGEQALTMGALFSGIRTQLMKPIFSSTKELETLSQRTQNLGLGPNLITATGLSNIFSKINIASFIGPAVIAATNIGRENGVPRAVAGGIGAIPGILMGNPIWSTIGSLIATGFYDKFLTFKGEIAADLTKWVSENPQTAPAGATPTWTESLLGSMKELLTGTPLPKAEIPTPESKLPTLDEQLEKMSQAILDTLGPLENLNISLVQMSTLTPEQKKAGFPEIMKSDTLTMLAMYAAQKQGKTIWGGKLFGVDKLPESVMKEIDDMLATFLVKQAESGFASTTIEVAKAAEIQKLGQLASTASADLMTKALNDIAKGATGGLTGLASAQQISKTLQTSAGTLIEAQKLTPGMKPITGPEAINLVTNLTPEESERLQTAASDIANGLSQLELNEAKMNDEKARGVQVDQILIDREKALNDQIAYARQLYPQLYAALKQNALARQAEAQMKPAVEVPEGITPEQLQKAIAAAEQMWMEYLKSQNIPQEQLDAWIAQQEEQILMAKDEVFSQTTKVPSKFLNLEFEKMGLTGPGTQINQNYANLTKAQMAGLMPQYQILKQALEKLGYKSNEEQLLIQNKDGWSLNHFDNTIMQLLTKDLIDETKKNGLQGMYNLPAEGTFYVPVTAYEMSKATTTEMAGGGGGLAGMSDLIAAITLLANSLQTTSTYTNLGTTSTSPTVAPSREEALAAHEAQLHPQPTQQTLLQQYTTANPLPVAITNWIAQNGQQSAGPTTPITPMTIQTLPQALPPSPGTQVNPQPQEPSLNLIQKLLQWLSQAGLLQNLPQLNTPSSPAGMGMTTGQAPTLTTALNLSVDSKITLSVDGRTLATIIKPYLYADLIRFNTTSPTSVSRSVIA